MPTVYIKSYPRIHLALLDMNGSLGRVNGGVGFAIDRPSWVLDIEPLRGRRARSLVIGGTGSARGRVATHLRVLERRFGRKCVRVAVRSEIPAHIGLGSGTSLLMAVTEGYFLALGLLQERDIVLAASGRGHTSGIGVTTYFDGGFVFDVGHHLSEAADSPREGIAFGPSSSKIDRGPPTVLLRQPMPGWGVVLVKPRFSGPSDAQERRFFNITCPIAERDVERVTRTVTLLAVPAILESDLPGFSRAVRLIQRSYWKRAEIAWYGRRIASLMKRLDRRSPSPFGMSSLGPSLFSVTDEVETVEDVVQETVDPAEWSVFCAKPRNSGRDVEIHRGGRSN